MPRLGLRFYIPTRLVGIPERFEDRRRRNRRSGRRRLCVRHDLSGSGTRAGAGRVGSGRLSWWPRKGGPRVPS